MMRTVVYAIILMSLTFQKGVAQRPPVGDEHGKVDQTKLMSFRSSEANQTLFHPKIITRTKITVRVLDNETLLPINAKIIVVGRTPGVEQVPSYEDRVSNFRIPANDTSIITVYADGYETLTESVLGNKMSPTEIFYLTRKVPDLHSVDVKNSESKFPEVSGILNYEISLVIYFSQSKAEVLPTSLSDLERMTQFLKNHENMGVELAGHTDNLGDPVKNFYLSGHRTDMVKAFLLSSDILSKRIRSKAYGSHFPVAPNDTEQNRKLNRRVEVRIKKLAD